MVAPNSRNTIGIRIEALQYSQSDGLESDKLEDKLLNSFLYGKRHEI